MDMDFIKVVIELQVLVSDCGVCEKVFVFEDEFVVIVLIVLGDLFLGCLWCCFGIVILVREVFLLSCNFELFVFSSSVLDFLSLSFFFEDEVVFRFKKFDFKLYDKDGYLNLRDSSDSSDGDNDFSKEGNVGVNGC